MPKRPVRAAGDAEVAQHRAQAELGVAGSCGRSFARTRDEGPDDVAQDPPRTEEVPLNAAPAGRSSALHELALTLTGIAHQVASVDPVLDRALRERTHAIALMHTRRRAARRVLARLRAIDRAHRRIYDLDADFSNELIKDLSLISFHAENLERALCSVPSYEFPIDDSEVRGWVRSFARTAGIDAGLISLVDPDAIRRMKRDLAEAVEHAQNRVETLLNTERATTVQGDQDEPNIND
ncbi:hypothetical protein [Actinomadura violacea]|uniref:Uncharacterized protein n=1 Tax=Actinomadura violacea TaxID=2819934 RepID=A0ABS3RL69_9ACTN|nr:hypothetical protein [Actinomadura violacea]MBO2457486.1 hypothetical protein [Actinomadura violacea]